MVIAIRWHSLSSTPLMIYFRSYKFKPRPSFPGACFLRQIYVYLHMYQFNFITQSCPTLCDPMDCSNPRFPCFSLSPQVYSNSRPLSRWCHPIISSSAAPFSSHLQSFPASGSFQWISSSHQVAKILEFQLQHPFFQWIFRTDYPLGWTGWISLQSKGLSRVFFNTTVQKHQFFCTQLSL